MRAKYESANVATSVYGKGPTAVRVCLLAESLPVVVRAPAGPAWLRPGPESPPAAQHRHTGWPGQLFAPSPRARFLDLPPAREPGISHANALSRRGSRGGKDPCSQLRLRLDIQGRRQVPLLSRSPGLTYLVGRRDGQGHGRTQRGVVARPHAHGCRAVRWIGPKPFN